MVGKLLSGMVGIFLSVNTLMALGVGASPGKLELFATPGETLVTDEITLLNPDNFGKTITISPKLRSDQKGTPILPSAEWVRIIPNKVTLKPLEKDVRVRMEIFVPDSQIYYNRNFAFEIDIRQCGNGAYAAGIIIPVLLTTQSSRHIPPKCPGCIANIYPNKLVIKSHLDSVCVVNWTDDTLNFKIGWNEPGQIGWQQALLLMERIMGTFVPIKDSFTLLPKEKKKIFIKPLAYPGKGKLYFSTDEDIKIFLWLEWGQL